MITIRNAKPSDAAALLSIYAPYVKNTAISFEYAVPSLDEFSSRIEKTLQKYPYLVAESDGVIVGYAYAGVFKNRTAYDHSVETTVYISKNSHRQGVGKLLYEALQSRLSAQGITNLYACVAVPEHEDEYLTFDSIKFHQALGFEIVGRFHKCGCKFSRWYDMVWMEKIIGEHK